MRKNLCILAVLALAACGGEPIAIKVTAAEYGDKWPLNIPEAWLDCDEGNITYIDTGAVKYALNGKALSAGLQRPTPLAKDPNTLVFADFSPRAFEVCKKKFGG